MTNDPGCYKGRPVRPHASAIVFEHDEDELTVPGTALPHAGFRSWAFSPEFPERARASWIDGQVLVDTSPEALDGHNLVKTELTAALHAIARREGLGEVYADRVLLTNRAARLSTEADLTFVSFEAIESGRARYRLKSKRSDVRMELIGAPDLVVEILGDSSVRKDDVLLRAAYARAGITEYGIIDARSDEIRFDILVLREGIYRKARKSRAFGRRFRLGRRRNRIGRWEYVLNAS